MEALIAKIYELITVFGVKILAAVAVFIIGRWVAKLMRRIVKKVMEKRSVDPTIGKFVRNLLYIALLTFFILGSPVPGNAGERNTFLIKGFPLGAQKRWRIGEFYYNFSHICRSTRGLRSQAPPHPPARKEKVSPREVDPAFRGDKERHSGQEQPPRRRR